MSKDSNNPKGGTASEVSNKKPGNYKVQKPRAIRMAIKEPILLHECPSEIKHQIQESDLPTSSEDQDVFVTFKVKL